LQDLGFSSLLTFTFYNTWLYITGLYVGHSDLKTIMVWDKIPLLFFTHYFASAL